MSPLKELTEVQKIIIEKLNKRDTLSPERHFNRENGQTNPNLSTQEMVSRILVANKRGRFLGKH